MQEQDGKALNVSGPHERWQNYNMTTSCGAGHNKPSPPAATYATDLLTPVLCCHLANATDSALWPVITNNLTFDPPTRLPELTQNWIRSSHGHSTPSLKISCKSVQPFSRNVADKETNKERKKSVENNTPSPYRGRGNKVDHFCTNNRCPHRHRMQPSVPLPRDSVK